MNIAVKYRIKPNAEQQTLFCKTFGCTRLLYNQLLQWQKTTYKQCKNDGIDMPPLPLVTTFKQQFSFMSEIDSLALMNARRHFQDAMKRFFTKQNDFPTFKKKQTAESYSTNNVNDNITVGKDYVKLPKVGKVKIKKHRKPPRGRLLSATVSRTSSGKWFVSLMYDVQSQHPEKRGGNNVVGLDMSLTHFVVSSSGIDNTKTKYVKKYKENERQLARLQRRLSKCEKGSKNREKARVRLAKKHEHVANCRRDFCIKEALYYARTYDVIVIEDLDMQAMSQSLHLGKSVTDLGFGLFRSWLQWQSMKHGSEVVIADKWFASSKTCNACGVKNEFLKLSDRKWVCPHCGEVHNRDYNAACNLRDWYLAQKNNTAGTAGINACGDTTSAQYAYTGYVLSLNQEAPFL